MENQPNETATLGTPNAEATHWTIARLVNGKTSRLDHPNDEGVRIREWPLSDLSLATIRERWGAGTFKCHYHRVDPDAEDATDRRRPLNAGPTFTLEPEPSIASVKAPVSPMPAAPGGDMSSALQFATALMQMSDARASATLQAVTQMAGISRPAEGGGSAELLAKLAALEAKIEADRREREIQDAHRAELARRDAELADLRRRIEDAERDDESDDAPAAPIFRPGVPFLEQVGFALLNAAAAKPELAAEVLGPIVAKFTGEKAAPVADPPPRVAPAPIMPRPAPRAVVARPRVDEPEPMPTGTPSWTPIGGVPVTSANGEPIGTAESVVR